MSDASGGSGGGEWVGARYGGAGAVGGSSGVERGGSASSMATGSEGDRKGDGSCSDDGHVGRAGDGEGICKEGDWLFVGDDGDDDMGRTDDGGENKGSDASYGCEDGQTGEDVGLETGATANKGVTYRELATRTLSRTVATMNGQAMRVRVQG